MQLLLHTGQSHDGDVLKLSEMHSFVRLTNSSILRALFSVLFCSYPQQDVRLNKRQQKGTDDRKWQFLVLLLFGSQIFHLYNENELVKNELECY